MWLIFLCFSSTPKYDWAAKEMTEDSVSITQPNNGSRLATDMFLHNNSNNNNNNNNNNTLFFDAMSPYTRLDSTATS